MRRASAADARTWILSSCSPAKKSRPGTMTCISSTGMSNTRVLKGSSKWKTCGASKGQHESQIPRQPRFACRELRFVLPQTYLKTSQGPSNGAQWIQIWDYECEVEENRVLLLVLVVSRRAVAGGPLQ